MKSAPKPENEPARIKRLKQLKVLDTPIEERFERITRIVCRTLNVPISAVSLVDNDRQWFKSVQGLNVSETPRDVAFCAHAILDEGPFIVSDATTDPRFVNNPLVTGDPSIRFYAGCPIDLGDGLRIGTLCAIDNKPRTISEEDVKSLRDLADMVRSEFQSIALSEAHQGLVVELEEAERAALIDSLSRLWNRAGAENLLKREWELVTRNASPLSLVMVDIDHFKNVNDTHGHDAGDRVIKRFAAILLGALRPYDTVARWGGEEFLIMLPGCDGACLEETLERIMDAIHESKFSTGREEIRVTASLGGTTIRASRGLKVTDYIKLADTALYAAKSAGRDQFRIATM